MKNVRPFLSVLVAATVALAYATAWADSAANIQGYANNSAVTYNDNGSGNFPVVTAIVTSPGTVDGYTYRNWSYFVQDSSINSYGIQGSLDLFYASSLTAVSGYTPHVGDQIIATGNYTPYSGIPEIAHSSTHPLSISYDNSMVFPFYGPALVVTTIPTINVPVDGHMLSSSGLSATLIELDRVTISGAPNFLYHANDTRTVTDLNGNSMTLYLWASSYSTCGALGGTSVYSGEYVNMTGFISDYYNTATGITTAEFVPTSITLIPEPMGVTLCGLGCVLAWVYYGLRRKV